MKLKSIVMAAALCSASFSVVAADFMSGEQIKATVSGKTMTWEHMFKSKSGKSYYAEDGTITGIKNGSPREGTWKIEGDNLCVSYGKCLAIEADGNGGFYKVKNGSKRVVHVTVIEDGKTVK